jgi:hypothetical protein
MSIFVPSPGFRQMHIKLDSLLKMCLGKRKFSQPDGIRRMYLYLNNLISMRALKTFHKVMDNTDMTLFMPM